MLIIARSILSLFFLASAWKKLKTWHASVLATASMLGKMSPYALAVTVAVETLLAILLFAPSVVANKAAQLGVAFVVIFTIYYAVQLILVETVTCACFGSSQPTAVKEFGDNAQSIVFRALTPARHGLMNSALVAMLVALQARDLPTSLGTLMLDCSPVFVICTGLAVSIIQRKGRSRQELHPMTRTLTVDTHTLGRCKRLSGRTTPWPAT